jgi:hypothetical protein
VSMRTSKATPVMSTPTSIALPCDPRRKRPDPRLRNPFQRRPRSAFGPRVDCLHGRQYTANRARNTAPIGVSSILVQARNSSRSMPAAAKT